MASYPSSSAPAPADDLLIADQRSFDRLIPRLAANGLVAVDTEAASFHKYLDRVYLLQLSSRDETAVVDPLAVKDLSAFGAMLADPAIEVVFHDADYDLRLLHQEFGYQATHLFDTRVAAQLLDEPGIGLAALLEKYLGMRIDKRFQRADWSIRPLSENARLRRHRHPSPGRAARHPAQPAGRARAAGLGRGGVRGDGGRALGQ